MIFESKADPNTTTIAQARALMQPYVQKQGAVCPCCRQLVKVYEREITSSMAYVLILLHKRFLTSTDWLHVPTFLSEKSKVGAAVRGGDWAKLRYWGLIEEKPNEVRT